MEGNEAANMWNYKHGYTTFVLHMEIQKEISRTFSELWVTAFVLMTYTFTVYILYFTSTYQILNMFMRSSVIFSILDSPLQNYGCLLILHTYSYFVFVIIMHARARTRTRTHAHSH